MLLEDPPTHQKKSILIIYKKIKIKIRIRGKKKEKKNLPWPENEGNF